MQSNNVAVLLCTLMESDFSNDCATLSDKKRNCEKSNVLKYLTKGDDTALAAVVSRLLSCT
jgi:hypothetical protein